MGWGRAEHPLPRPEPSDPTSKERGGEVGRKRDTGDDATGRGARVVPGRGWRRGGAGGKAEESRLSHPTPTLHAAPHLLARPLIPYHRKGHWADRPPGARRLPGVFPSLPSHRAPHGWRRGEAIGRAHVQHGRYDEGIGNENH